MASQNVKLIEKGKKEVQPAHNVWEVMKPFAHFGLKATGLLASALITVVKSVPKPDKPKQPESKNTKVIHI